MAFFRTTGFDCEMAYEIFVSTEGRLAPAPDVSNVAKQEIKALSGKVLNGQQVSQSPGNQQLEPLSSRTRLTTASK